MNTKVTLTGAHGTGKTTLLDALSADLTENGVSHLIVPEVPRIACEAVSDPHFFRRGANSLSKQLTLLIGQGAYEISLMQQTPLLICDRMMIDHWAYTRVLFADEVRSSGIGDFLEKLVRLHSASYDHVYYIPIEFAPRDDGTREDDANFQSLIDEEIRLLLDTYEVQFTEISGSVRERTNVILHSMPPN